MAIDPLSEDLSRRFVFPPLQKSKTKEDLMLTVTVDLNKPTHAILPKLYAEFGKEGLLNIPKKMVQEELDGTVKITLTRIPSKLN